MPVQLTTETVTRRTKGRDRMRAVREQGGASSPCSHPWLKHLGFDENRTCPECYGVWGTWEEFLPIYLSRGPAALNQHSWITGGSLRLEWLVKIHTWIIIILKWELPSSSSRGVSPIIAGGTEGRKLSTDGASQPLGLMMILAIWRASWSNTVPHINLNSANSKHHVGCTV